MEKFFALNEEKQKTILDAAMGCFGRFGYEKTSVNDIAVAAHISKASVFQYFGSKKELYQYLIGYCREVVTTAFDRRALDEKGDLLDRILLSGEMKMKTLQAHPCVTQFVTSVWEETSPEVGDVLAALRADADQFRNELVLRADDAVKFKNPQDAETVFQMLLLVAEGYAARYRSAPVFAYETVMEEFGKMIRMLKQNFYKEEYL